MLATLSVIACLVRQAQVPDVLFAPQKLSCRDWTEVANYYIDLGEDKAVDSLVQETISHPKNKVNTRVCLICRILFQPKGKHPLRPPALGDLSLPRMTMPLSSWPEFPLVQQDGVWFVLDENYKQEGVPERAGLYIDYCRKNGRFRIEKLAVPTAQQAVDAVKSLQASKRWMAIRWSDSDLHTSYTYDRTWTADLLRSQTRFRDGE
jgi:hypothetical protein